ncbi:MAG: TonB-dependent receptor, partial [Pyrinomonadaceae bacterium]
LYLQAPGSVNSGSGTFGDIRFSGRAVEQNTIRYDGIEGTSIIDASPGSVNGEISSPFRLQSSLENVQEFRVDSSNFPAEYGTGTGGQINVVTKSGSNQFHGSLFEYLRNDKLDARNFFDNIAPNIPKSSLRLNQFGGSLGGPIAKDKAFFFFSYEGYRLSAGINSVEQVPGLASRVCANIVCAPSALQLIPAFRDPNAIVLQTGPTNPTTDAARFDVIQLQSGTKVDENSVAARFDFKLDDKNSVYFRYFRDQGFNNQPEGVTGRRVEVTAVPQNAVFSAQSILSPNLLNEVKIGYNSAYTRINGLAPLIPGLDLSAAAVNISGSTASFSIAGQGSAATAVAGGLVRANSATNGRGQPYTPYSISLIDGVNYTRGNHSFKLGGEARLVRIFTDRLGGTTYTYSNVTSFLTGGLQQVQFLGDVSAPSPFNTGAFGERRAEQEYYIGYVQDEWKIRPNLTLNYGLRYEYYTPLREAHDLQVLFDIATGTLRPRIEDAFKSSKTNFGPRIALTWSPNYNSAGFIGGGRTVLRGGFGIYYGPGQTEDQIQPIESDRISSTLTNSNVTPLIFPINTAAIVTNFSNNPNNRQFQPRAYANDYEIPEKVYQYTFSIQQELPYNMVATIGYVGSQGRNLFLRSVANKILPGQTTITNGTALPTDVGVINRTNAAGRVIGVDTVREFSIVSGTTALNPFAEVDYKTSGGSDSYNALQTALSRRFNTGLSLNAQYTFGRSFGNTAGSNEARTSAALDNFEADRGYNNFDVRHTFNLSAL